MPKVVVVGLGPAGPEFVTEVARTYVQGALPVWLRTARHPSASIARNASTFDDVYDHADTIESVYGRIVDSLVEEASEHDEVVYAVPGSPLVAEATVDQLRADVRVDVEIIPALSFLDLAWLRLGVDPLAAGPRLVDGRRFAVGAAGERGPLLVAQCDASWVLSEIKLAFEDDVPESVTILQRLGLADERVETISWEDLDRSVDPDHLTSIWIPSVTAPVAFELARVDEVARRLRRDCPWDQEQTHASLGQYAIEEVYELLDAIENREAGGDDPSDEHLIEELGDVLFQVFAHAAIAAEEGRFNVSDIARTVSDKLIERHPHVYGDVVAETSDDVKATWESNKKAAKGRTSVMDGIPRQLPALLYAWKVLHRAAAEGVEVTEADVKDTGVGGALLLMVDEARRLDEEPEAALRRTTDRFLLTFEVLERQAGQEIERHLAARD